MGLGTQTRFQRETVKPLQIVSGTHVVIARRLETPAFAASPWALALRLPPLRLRSGIYSRLPVLPAALALPHPGKHCSPRHCFSLRSSRCALAPFDRRGPRILIPKMANSPELSLYGELKLAPGYLQAGSLFGTLAIGYPDPAHCTLAPSIGLAWRENYFKHPPWSRTLF